MQLEGRYSIDRIQPASDAGEGLPPARGGLAPPVKNGDLARKPMTDLGNAERFVSRCGDRFLFVPTSGWFAWDGRRWARDGADELVARAAHETARAIQDEAEALRGTPADLVISDRGKGDPLMLSDKLVAWGRASETEARMRAIPKIASAYLSVPAKDLDADPWVLNCFNGTVRLKANGQSLKVEFTQHNPSDRITKLSLVEYDPKARCPIYDRFLSEVQPRVEVRRFLHMWGGYSLTGEVGEQKLCFFYGKGKNGKSTLVDSWGFVAGDYGETVPIETFLDQGKGRNAGGATPDLALLPGVRFLRTSEPEKGAKLAEALIKLVTGGEPIQARHLNRDYFKFRPAFKLTMSGNYRPSIDGTDEGIWRRLILVPWGVKVENADLTLPFKLQLEASGILNRLIKGLQDYVRHGLIVPDDVVEATSSYRLDSDPLGRFLATATQPVAGERIQSSVLHRTFTAWARASGEREWTPKGLTLAMKERGYRTLQSNVVWWRDLKLVMHEVDFTEGLSPPPNPDD